MWNYQDQQGALAWPAQPANFAIFPAVPQGTMPMPQGTMPVPQGTVPMAQQQLPPQTAAGQPQFDPWMAALAAGLSAPAVPAVQPGNTGGSGAGLEPQQSVWRDYAPTRPAPRYTPQPQGLRSDDAQSARDAYFGPSYGADRGTRQRNAAQTAAED